MKKYSGWYVISKLSNVMENISPIYSSKYNGSLTIDSSKLILNFKKTENQLLKSEINSIESLFIGRFKINHSNPSLPEFLIFSAWWPFGPSKKLKEFGYPVK
jgi:hypothetical protein